MNVANVSIRDFADKRNGARKGARLAGVISVVKRSPLENPYLAGRDGTREEVVDYYRVWLWNRVAAGDPRVIDALRQIAKSGLVGCWCDTGACRCHARIVARVAGCLGDQLRHRNRVAAA